MPFNSNKLDENFHKICNRPNHNNNDLGRYKTLTEKFTDLEHRSHQNKLQFGRFFEQDDVESWDDSEYRLKKFIEDELNIERAHRVGKALKNGERNKSKTIFARFLSFKQKNLVLNKFREKKLWNKQKYVNKDFSEE